MALDKEALLDVAIKEAKKEYPNNLIYESGPQGFINGFISGYTLGAKDHSFSNTSMPVTTPNEKIIKV